MRKVSFIFVTLILCACAPTAKLVDLESEFNATEAASLLESGPNSITGSAVIRQRGGSTVNCAGNDVRLIPVTDYTTERIRTIYGETEQGYVSFSGSVPMYEFDPDPAAYYQNTRIEQCDAQGMFEFTHIADGQFFVVTTIIWESGNLTYGGHLMRSVSLEGGETKRVILSP